MTMRLTPERAQVYYRTMTTERLALKYGKTPMAMRQWLHREGIRDPKRSRRERIVRLVVKFSKDFGWGVSEIAEQLGMSRSDVKRVLRKVFGAVRQLSLWSEDAFRVNPVRIVHVRQSKPVSYAPDPNQMSLLDQLNQAA